MPMQIVDMTLLKATHRVTHWQKQHAMDLGIHYIMASKQQRLLSMQTELELSKGFLLTLPVIPAQLNIPIRSHL